MTEQNKKGRVLQGIVVSNKMQKTAVVKVNRRVKHKTYGKIVTRSTKLHVHDPEQKCIIGDEVMIKETKPFSKTKCWELISILDKTG